MLTRSLLICAFSLSCFMGLQALELCDKNKEETQLLAGCCKGKCNKRTMPSDAYAGCCKKRGCKKSVLSCKKGDRKPVSVPETLLACKDC